MRAHYIVATYSGYIAGRAYDHILAEQVLQINLRNLYDIIESGQCTELERVTIVCPSPRPNELIYTKYYEKDTWINLFKKTSVELVYLQYKGPNQHHSYDMWIQGMQSFPEADYHIFLEDDYTLVPTQTQFVQKLVGLYKQKFPNNIGYLCTHVGTLNGYQHAAISNGIISRDTIDAMGGATNMLYELYNLPIFPQLAFSKIFDNHHIPILDWTSHFAADFFRSEKCQLEIYPSAEERLMIPVQKFVINDPTRKTVNINIPCLIHNTPCNHDTGI